MRQIDEDVIYIIICLIFIAIGGGIVSVVKYNKCHSQFGRSGFAVEWGPIQGCMVEVRKGIWLPSSSIRDVSLDNTAKQ